MRKRSRRMVEEKMKVLFTKKTAYSVRCGLSTKHSLATPFKNLF